MYPDLMATLSLVATVVGSFLAGAFLWTLGEYLLHSSFHWAKGKNFASRSHLDHHVHAGWIFDPVITLAWLGIVLVGAGIGAAVESRGSPPLMTSRQRAASSTVRLNGPIWSSDEA